MTPTEPTALMTICEVLSWIVLGGSIGGVTAMLIRVKVVKDGMLLDNDVTVRSRTLLGLAMFSSFIGSAAALAIQWLLIGINKFDSTADVKNTIFILAISVVAGYGARQILPMLTRRFEKELEDVKEDLTKDLTQTKKEVIQKVETVDRFTRSLTSLRPGAPKSELHENRSELESYLRSHPTDRRAAIILARICRADNDLGQAIAILDKFLKAKEGLKEFDKDYADALYNRACYKLKLWESNKQEVKYKDQAYEDLKRSIELSPPNKVDAESDEDFKALWQEDRFKALGAAEQKKATLPP